MNAGVFIACRHYGGSSRVAAVDCTLNLRFHGSLLCRRYFQNFAVVSQDAVAFLFNVGNLCINRHPQSLFLLKLLQAVCVVVIEIGISIGIIYGGIVDIRACPHVSLYEEVDAAELATRGHTFVYWIRGSIWGRVGVNIQKVSHLYICPSRYGMYEAAWVVIGIYDAVDSPMGVCHTTFDMLPPAFVDYHPRPDAGMLTRGIDECFILAIEVLHGIVDVAYRTASAA